MLSEQREILVRLGVPANAIVRPCASMTTPPGSADVTSKYHLRRAGLAIRREMGGTGVQVAMDGTRYEDADPNRWWATRRDLRWVLDDSAKLIAYELGLGAQAESSARADACSTTSPNAAAQASSVRSDVARARAFR